MGNNFKEVVADVKLRITCERLRKKSDGLQ
jgi:hypothetical protein